MGLHRNLVSASGPGERALAPQLITILLGITSFCVVQPKSYERFEA